MTAEIKELNKVEDIKSELGSMYQSVQRESSNTLQQVKQKFSQHETVFKQKLCSYVQLIKSNLQTLAQEPSPKIGDLKKKIEELAGTKDGTRGAKKNGKIEKLKDAMRALESMHRGKSFWQLMRPGPFEQTEIRTLKNNALMAQLFIDKTFENFMSFDKTQTRLEDIIPILEGDGNIGYLVGEIDSYEASNIEEYNKKINDHERKIQNLNILGQYKSNYESSLRGTKSITNNMKTHKTNITSNGSKFKEEYLRAFEAVPDIDTELDGITTKLKDIIEIVDLIEKYIHNTRLFFGYLKLFQEHKTKIEKLQIKGDNISDIQNTISTLSTAIGTITEALSPIHDEKQKLEGYKETWQDGRDRQTQMVSIRKWYFPGEFNLVSPFKSLTVCLDKLLFVKYFNLALGQSDLKSHLNLIGVSINGTRGIGDLLDAMKKMDSCLSSVKEIIGKLVGMIESSHESNKSKVNGAPNGNSIQVHVGKIKQIPDKIADLHKSVRIYIHLTQLVSNVVRTLDKMNPKAGKLKETNGIVEDLRNDIESIISDLKSVYWNTVYMPNIGEQMRLYNINFATNKLEEYLKNLDGDIKSIRKIESDLGAIMTKLQEYQEILEDIYGKINDRTSKILIFIQGGHSFRSIVEAFAADQTRSGFVCLKQIIGYLAKIMLIITSLIKTICRIQRSIHCTKRKIGCFVSSLETRARWIGEGVREVELSIESVIICFLKCSNKSITNNTKESTKRMLTSGGLVYNNKVAKQFLRCLKIYVVSIVFNRILATDEACKPRNGLWKVKGTI